MKISRRVGLISIAIGMVMVSGCDPTGPALTQIEEPRKVMLLSARGGRSFESGQRILMAQLMANDSRFQLQVMDAGFDVEKQRAQLKAAVTEKAFAVLIDPVEVEPLRPDVRDAVTADVLMIGLGKSSEELGCQTVVFADQRKMGQSVGDLAVRALRAKAAESGKTEAEGRVIEIRGDDESEICHRRHEGFESALKAAPGVILVHDAPGDWTLEGGRGRTQDALRLQQSFDLVFAHNDLMALGAAKALKDRRAEVMIIGMDGFRGQEGGMTLVGDGEIDATVYQPMLVDLAWVLIRKKVQDPSFKPKPLYEMTSRVITPKDVDDIRRNGLPALPDL